MVTNRTIKRDDQTGSIRKIRIQWKARQSCLYQKIKDTNLRTFKGISRWQQNMIRQTVWHIYLNRLERRRIEEFRKQLQKSKKNTNTQMRILVTEIDGKVDFRYIIGSN